MGVDANIFNGFLGGIKEVLEQFGITDIKKKNLSKKERFDATYEVAIIIGVTGDLKGNVNYNFSKKVGKALASKMMMGMPVEDFDEMAKSALSELSNMMSGKSAARLEAIGKTIDISPPTLVVGDEMDVWFEKKIKIIAIDLDTSIGEIEVNIGLEV
ncbi:MAG: chemotaxis protein CheX [Fusobacteriota bacterium]